MTTAVAVAAAKTSTGNQDITASLGGATPKAVLFLYSRSPANGTITAGGGDSFGMADAASQNAVASIVPHGVPTSPFLGRVWKSDKCIVQLQSSGGSVSVHSEAAFVAFIANGVRINWTTASTAGWLVTALFFSGSDWTVAGGHVSSPNSPGTDVNVGFQADAVILIGGMQDTAGTIATDRVKSSFGMAVPGAPFVRTAIYNERWAWTITRQLVNLVSTSAINATAAGANYDPFGTQFINATALPAGFNVTGGGYSWGYLALKYTGAGIMKCGILNITAASGAQAITGIGGEPSFMVVFARNDIDSARWLYGDFFLTEAKSGGYAVGATSAGSSPSTGEIVHATAAEDTILLLDAAGAVDTVATLTSFDADGLTLNFSDPPPANIAWPYFALLGGASSSAERLFGTIID